MRWLVAPAALALVLAFCSAQPAEAHRWGPRYRVHAPCHYSYGGYPYGGYSYGGYSYGASTYGASTYGAYYGVPRVSVYRVPLVAPSPVRYYQPYGAYYGPRPVVRYRVW